MPIHGSRITMTHNQDQTAPAARPQQPYLWAHKVHSPHSYRLPEVPRMRTNLRAAFLHSHSCLLMQLGSLLPAAMSTFCNTHQMNLQDYRCTSPSLMRDHKMMLCPCSVLSVMQRQIANLGTCSRPYGVDARTGQSTAIRTMQKCT